MMDPAVFLTVELLVSLLLSLSSDQAMKVMTTVMRKFEKCGCLVDPTTSGGFVPRPAPEQH